MAIEIISWSISTKVWGWDGTPDPWICSQTRCQLRYSVRQVQKSHELGQSKTYFWLFQCHPDQPSATFYVSHSQQSLDQMEIFWKIWLKQIIVSLLKYGSYWQAYEQFKYFSRTVNSAWWVILNAFLSSADYIQNHNFYTILSGMPFKCQT